ncbi:MAG: HAMP domain-containing histidine kinase [Gemmatimonadaceae bacterium]|nr:HAMP domain-containing histidine kinase [Gemmatimonadaceae bacterium]
MTPQGASRASRTSSGYLALTAALIVLVALVAGATWQALRAEASNRATAERALHDYSAVAAWHFAQQASDALHNIGGPRMNTVDPGNGRAPPERLAHPATLLTGEREVCCTAETGPAFAFRIDLPGNSVVSAGEAPDASDLAELAASVPPLMQTGGAERHRFVAPTIGGRPMRIAAVLIVDTDAARTPRAIYGIAVDSASVARQLARIHRSGKLLPPALVGRAPLRDRLHIAVSSPDGYPLYASGPPIPSTVPAADRVAVEQGHLIVHAAIDPALAPALVIGGLPSSRVPALLAVLALGILLAGAGLMQLRRERELMRLRTRFVANVSHELRTPLAQISMFGETLMLGRARSDEERHHFAAIIHREARRLTRLVEGVLRFSHQEAGGTTLRLEPRDLSAELGEAADDFAPLAAAAESRLAVNGPRGIVVNSDPGALRQIVLNLFENAVKYGPRGQTILVQAAVAGPEARISVEDQGPGIPRGDRRRVLDPFTRLERTDHPKVAGTGIGLAVVHELVRAHGGRLWIEEAPGGGARVCFTLPLATPDHAPADLGDPRPAHLRPAVG